MKLSEIISVFELIAPITYQEDYDNSGLTVGDSGMDITAALLCIDVTLPVIEEAVQLCANLVISHHPVIFTPLKRITASNYTEKIILSAIRNNIAIYSAHTNLDNIFTGVNHKISQKLGLENIKMLVPFQNGLKKLVTYVPLAYADDVRMALFNAGAGHIGNYDACSFNTEGKGSFRPLDGTRPFVGEAGNLHFEEEMRLETVFPAAYKARIIETLLKAHPYEEIAYDIYPIENTYELAGAGMIGTLKKSADEADFLNQVKDIFGCKVLRHSQLLHKPVKTIAICGGSGSFLINRAISAGADMFLTGDIKYHQFFEADEQIVIVDLGHYESEQFTIEIFYDILIKNLPNFAIHFSSIRTSPIYYL
jgi:dinuclear metal center YbgI/SA1388 family protein